MTTHADPERSPYLRSVTFLDRVPDDETQPPVHVVGKTLLDGVDHSYALPGPAANHDWIILGQQQEGTVVSFVMYAKYATFQTSADKTVGTHICGIPVLTPGDREWEPLPGNGDEYDLVRVYFYARQIEVTAVKADSVETAAAGHEPALS